MRAYFPLLFAYGILCGTPLSAQDPNPVDVVDEARAILEEVRETLDHADTLGEVPLKEPVANHEPVEALPVSSEGISAKETDLDAPVTDGSIPLEVQTFNPPPSTIIEVTTPETASEEVEASAVSIDLSNNFQGVDTDDASYDPRKEDLLSDVELECSEEDQVEFYPIDDIIRIHAAKMKKESRLHWKASKGIHDDPVHHLEMVYFSYHAMTIEKARKLLVYAVQSLLKDLHPGEWTHPALAHGFCPADLTIEIVFDNFHGQYVDRQFVQRLRMTNEIITYWAYNCEKHGKCYTRKERYWDAQHFVQVDLELENKHRALERRRDVGEGVENVIPWENIFDIER